MGAAALVFAVALVAGTLVMAAGSAAQTPSPLRSFTCAPIEGLRADSVARGEFLDAFDRALSEHTLMVTGTARGESRVTPFETRFRLGVEGEAGAWSMRLVVMLPPMAATTREEVVREGRRVVRRSVTKSNPHKRRSRRIGLSMVIQSPSERMAGSEPEAMLTSIAFPAPPAPEGTQLLPAPGGYELPWADAGRAAGLLALEALHRRSGDLPPAARVDVTPIVRADLTP